MAGGGGKGKGKSKGKDKKSGSQKASAKKQNDCAQAGDGEGKKPVNHLSDEKTSMHQRANNAFRKLLSLLEETNELFKAHNVPLSVEYDSVQKANELKHMEKDKRLEDMGNAELVLATLRDKLFVARLVKSVAERTLCSKSETQVQQLTQESDQRFLIDDSAASKDELCVWSRRANEANAVAFQKVVEDGNAMGIRFENKGTGFAEIAGIAAGSSGVNKAKARLQKKFEAQNSRGKMWTVLLQDELLSAMDFFHEMRHVTLFLAMNEPLYKACLQKHNSLLLAPFAPLTDDDVFSPARYSRWLTGGLDSIVAVSNFVQNATDAWKEKNTDRLKAMRDALYMRTRKKVGLRESLMAAALAGVKGITVVSHENACSAVDQLYEQRMEEVDAGLFDGVFSFFGYARSRLSQEALAAQTKRFQHKGAGGGERAADRLARDMGLVAEVAESETPEEARTRARRAAFAKPFETSASAEAFM